MNLNKSSYPELIKKLPQEVYEIFEVFGDNIRLVGGSVRDLLLDKKINDFDFATKLLPEEITKILKKSGIKAIPTGIKFGTITAVINHKNFEITTLRKDNETDGRHCIPEFVDDYYLDASRRDFTINALYLDSKGNVDDYFDGISDLKAQKVRFIGNAKQRIEEDYLRILRFFRFSCRYANEVDSEGLKACIEKKEGLKNLSKERIRQEFLKLLLSGNDQKIVSILKIIKSEGFLAEIFSSEVDITAFETLISLEKELNFTASQNLKIATLFLSNSFEIIVFRDEFCITNFEKKYLSFISDNQKEPCSLDELKTLLVDVDKNWVEDLYLFILSKSKKLPRTSESKDVLNFLEDFVLPKFPLNGDDIKNLGVDEKEIGNILKHAKRIWSKNSFKFDKETLISLILGSKSSN